MSYEAELLKDQFQSNVVLRINGGLYFAKRQPDSGLAVPTAQCVIRAKGGLTINPQVIDLLGAKTSFASNTFSLVDRDGIVTGLFADNRNVFMGQRVEIWLGRSGVALDFADYKKLPDSFIKGVGFKGQEYTFTAAEITSQLKKPVFNKQSPLLADTAAGAATLVAQFDISAFPAAGRLFLKDEFLTYSSKVDGTKTFTLVGVTANNHDSGDPIYNVYQVVAQNPVDVFLRILQSTGGSTYDSYPEGLGLADAEIDLAAIEAIRDEVFVDEEFTFELYGIPKILDWLEQEILKTCNLRIISSPTSKLSLKVLDQSIFGSTVRVDASSIDPRSVDYHVDDSEIKNVVEFRYGYDHATNIFTRVWREQDDESITNYGEQEPFIIEAKGVPATDAGDDIAQDRALRWVGRLATATPTISVDTFFRHSLVSVGDRLLLVYDLPNEYGTRDFAKDLEVLSKGIDEEKGIVKFKLGFTNYTGIREAYISPSDKPAVVLAQNAVQVPLGRGAQYSIGWVMRLNNPGFGNTADEPRTIALIDGDNITFDADFDVTPLDLNHRIQFADYDEVVQDQRRYAFISVGAGNFPDGTRPYQITF